MFYPQNNASNQPRRTSSPTSKIVCFCLRRPDIVLDKATRFSRSNYAFNDDRPFQATHLPRPYWRFQRLVQVYNMPVQEQLLPFLPSFCSDNPRATTNSSNASQDTILQPQRPEMMIEQDVHQTPDLIILLYPLGLALADQ